MSYLTSFGLNGITPGSIVQTLTGNSGGAVGPTGNTINVVGSGGITATGNSGTSTLTISSSGGGLAWTEVTGTSAAMAINNGYIANNAGLVTLTLPATAPIGSIVRVGGKGTGLWSIAQNSGQTVHFGNQNTTTGVGGSLSSILRYDCVELVCITADTDWLVLSVLGNLTVV
jgi:hypothetical protein